MPKSCLLPFEIGVDICHIPRISKIISSPPSYIYSKNKVIVSNEQQRSDTFRIRRRFFAHLFNFFERKYYKMLESDDYFWGNDQILSQKAYNFVAGRFAAKEAIIKAYRGRRLNFHDIVILPSKVNYLSLKSCGINQEELGVNRAPRAIVLAERESSNISNPTPPLVRYDHKSPCFLGIKEILTLPLAVKIQQNNARRSRSLYKSIKAQLSPEEYREEARRWAKGEEVRLNISHDGDYAIAVCLAQLKKPSPDPFSRFLGENLSESDNSLTTDVQFNLCSSQEKNLSVVDNCNRAGIPSNPFSMSQTKDSPVDNDLKRKISLSDYFSSFEKKKIPLALRHVMQNTKIDFSDFSSPQTQSNTQDLMGNNKIESDSVQSNNKNDDEYDNSAAYLEKVLDLSVKRIGVKN